MKPGTNRCVILSCLAAIGIGAAIIAVAQSSLADFGITEARLKPGIVGALVDGHLPLYPSKKAYSAAPVAVRVAFVEKASGWLKAYTESPTFKADYEKQRAAARPAPQGSKGTPDEQFAKSLEEQRKAIAEMKANVASMPADMQKQMEPAIKQAEAAMQKTAADPQMVAMMKQGFSQQATSDQESYQRRVAEYDARYPADTRILIAKRLQDFLDMSKDVDFDTKLIPGGGGRMRFVDPKYEAKPDQWKLCYRAGKEPVEAARAFATDWLRQLKTK